MFLPKKSSGFFHKNLKDFSIVFYVIKAITFIDGSLLNFIFYGFVIMNSQCLVKDTLSSVKSIDLEWVRAEFTELVEWSYDVVLEINSQKFLIRLVNDWNSIQNFEIVASKWFVSDLTNSLIFALRNLVESLQLALY